MGRKENRKINRALGISNQKLANAVSNPFETSDGTLIFPVGSASDAPTSFGFMSPAEFYRTTATLSDRDFNQLIYSQTKHAVEHGYILDWPEDDFAIVMWFEMEFITPEMREVFPAIIREYLEHEPMIGEMFDNVPYARMNENTWDDALNYRILAMMIMAARRGSTYSRNFLVSLYKEYYRPEYNRVRKLKKLTYLDVLELHDEDCHRKGYASGHATTNEKSYGDYILELRQHEAGWVNASGRRPAFGHVGKGNQEQLLLGGEDGHPSHVGEDGRRAELDHAANVMNEILPVYSRLFIMCEMMRIPIEPTCNNIAAEMTETMSSVANLTFLTSPEYRRYRAEQIERGVEFYRAAYPEIADPYLYQTMPEYFALELGQAIMNSAFHKYDSNVRLPYDSKKFDLPELFSEVALSLHLTYPEVACNVNQMQLLAMIRYLSECLCELMATRDKELDEVLHFRGKRFQGEWETEAAKDEAEMSETLTRNVERMRPTTLVPGSTGGPSEDVQTGVGSGETGEDIRLSQEQLHAQIEALKIQLAEREMQLAEAEQKIIRQRALYEKARDNERELERIVADREDEHTELIALREFVYGLRSEDVELDEADRERMVAELQGKKVAILGGHERWQKKMKRLFPGWTFISVDDDSIGSFNALAGADYIYVYTNALQHKQYYRAMNLIRREGKALFYLGGHKRECSSDIWRFVQVEGR